MMKIAEEKVYFSSSTEPTTFSWNDLTLSALLKYTVWDSLWKDKPNSGLFCYGSELSQTKTKEEVYGKGGFLL